MWQRDCKSSIWFKKWSAEARNWIIQKAWIILSKRLLKWKVLIRMELFPADIYDINWLLDLLIMITFMIGDPLRSIMKEELEQLF